MLAMRFYKKQISGEQINIDGGIWIGEIKKNYAFVKYSKSMLTISIN